MIKTIKYCVHGNNNRKKETDHCWGGEITAEIFFKIEVLGNGIFGQAGEFLGLISPAPALINSDERVSGLEYEFR